MKWFVAISILLIARTALAQHDGSSPPDPLSALPAGVGRDETFYLCSACHDFTLVGQQRLARERWDHLLDWMTTEQNMPALEGAERTLILDYLATNFGPVPETGKSRRRR